VCWLVGWLVGWLGFFNQMVNLKHRVENTNIVLEFNHKL
jgi:hypothetical protein